MAQPTLCVPSLHFSHSIRPSLNCPLSSAPGPPCGDSYCYHGGTCNTITDVCDCPTALSGDYCTNVTGQCAVVIVTRCGLVTCCRCHTLCCGCVVGHSHITGSGMLLPVTCHHIRTVNDLSVCVTGVCACSVCTSVAQVLVMHMHTQVSCVIGAFASTGCFCLNGGSCNNDDVCECPEQFTGTHCEQTLCKTHNYYLTVMLQPVVQWYSCHQPHIRRWSPMSQWGLPSTHVPLYLPLDRGRVWPV